MLDRITSEVRRLNGIITESLAFVKPISPNLVETEVLPMLDEAIQVAVDRRGADGVRLEADINRDLPKVPMDRAQLRQVFENLLLNALEAVGEEGEVRLEADMLERSNTYADSETAQVEQWVRIRVADSGPGVDDDTATQIFNPFFTTKVQGSGVGLSNAKKIVQSHRGQIDVGNGETGGAVFTVLLPLNRDAQ